MPDNTLSALSEICILVRQLTRSPSDNQLSTADIKKSINTFVLYDFPEHLRLFNLRKTVTFYTQPYIDTYSTTTTVLTDPMYNFKNVIISTHEPIYVAGYKIFFSQSREQFYGIYPMINALNMFTTGNGLTTNYVGTLPAIPILRNNVTFSSVDTANNGLALKDDGLGNIINANGSATVPASTINYVTGVYNINFTAAPAVGKGVYSLTSAYKPSLPLSALYFDGSIILRPVPDIPYPVRLEVFMRPTELLAGAQMPELSEWWQYIAYGASKKIFEKRMDMESVNAIMPEFKTQERLILRRTLTQMSNERSATIYTEQTSFGPGSSGYGWGGGLY